MKKSITHYNVKYYNKPDKETILNGNIAIFPSYVQSETKTIATIQNPEYMSVLMDSKSAWPFVVISGTPIYNNELKESISANKGIIYDAIKVGVFMREKFFIHIVSETLLSFNEVNDMLIGAGIYFLQYSQSKEQPSKRETIINSIMYLRGLRYLKEKNINLI